MDLTIMTPEERQDIKQKRVEFISNTLEDYTSLEQYARDKDEWFAILGIELELRDNYISLCYYLDPFEEEHYYIEPSSNGGLTVCAEEPLD